MKQKHYFNRMFHEILPEYVINQDIMMDEGMAVLYNTISNMLAQDALEENEEYEALIIDCGGGTTDLCSYRFRIQNRRAAYKIYMETTYENGDTDFGGNNLTYRIMQMLKIALVRAEGDGNVSSIKEILEYMDTDIYRFIDEHGVKEFYQRLDMEYQDFSFIKLTGQSCKIDLFKDALKEFVPGRMIQFRKKAGIDAADFELKMTCVDGALKYLREGAALRDSYKDFSDMATEYDTVNLVHATVAGAGEPTLHPALLRQFGEELWSVREKDQYDIGICNLIWNTQGMVERRVITEYLCHKAKRDAAEFCAPDGNRKIYDQLCAVLGCMEKLKKERTGFKRIIVD